MKRKTSEPPHASSRTPKGRKTETTLGELPSSDDEHFGQRSDGEEFTPQNEAKSRANELDGKTWTKYSISVWSDIQKTRDEVALGHPAIFPLALVSRLIEIFTNASQKVVFDPFAGIGSTILAAYRMGKKGVGIELNPEFADKARDRFAQESLFASQGGGWTIETGDCLDMGNYIDDGTVDLVVTSPPYWDVLNQKRSADGKEIRNYGSSNADLGNIQSYSDFLLQLRKVFELVFRTMRSGAYCCVVVMDLRKKDRFYPFHSDIAEFMQEIGFVYDDVIIWDRRHEYNNMRPLGYPYVFRVNKAHEFVLIFQKPRAIT